MNSFSNSRMIGSLIGCKDRLSAPRTSVCVVAIADVTSLPGIPPTGKKGEVPFTAIVNIRGDRLYHEHIAWDQGTALRQMGLLPEFLPYPYPLPDGSVPAQNHIFEYQVPVAGLQTAEKMREKNSVPSNEMLIFKIREVEDPRSSTVNDVIR